ncbi:glycosyltransferase WbuB [Polynucleobacter sp. JS-JIR-II-b4]|uniref:glycosyltransferase WbuB n=1 Tax=Polynucleobacter sp. JS-JIR-II-b4 TaxID=1758390 RepID=UPI001BFD5E5D|nr:glycosyltransferase WbuB [Polynucleobacter sp. JS-JIR-II-b4]QWE02852.1 glycosyltransferase WbuB [Polynucleobacter sp. JS-JIR-II-b4]
MKILLYGINYEPELTGVGKYTGEMARWLVTRGHDVRVVTAMPYYPQWKVNGKNWYRREILGGVQVWRCPLYVPPNPSGLKRVLNLASFALTSIPIMLRQIFWRPDVVWVVEPALICTPGGLIVALLSGAKTWLHIQDFEVDGAFDLGLVKSHTLKRIALVCERLVMKCFDRVSTISDNMLLLLQSKRVATHKTYFFPNWVDTAFIKPISIHESKHSSNRVISYRSEWGIPDEAIIALYSGNMGEKQGLETVIDAARKLHDEKSIFFVMCGDGAAFPRLRKMALELKNIHWIPLQPFNCLNELLNVADIHLLPQLAGAADLVMPSKLTGIFASGRPVVATAEYGTGIYKTVAKSGGGILVAPNNSEDLASAIIELADNPEKRQHLGSSARDYAIKHFDINEILSRFESELMGL